MRLAARRLADLCERLQLPGSLSQQAYTLVEHTLYEHTALLYNRHLDQILLCAVYGVCKVNKDVALRGRVAGLPPSLLARCEPVYLPHPPSLPAPGHSFLHGFLIVCP